MEPSRQTNNFAFYALGGLAVLGIFFSFWNRLPSALPAETGQANKEAACANDLDCWSDKWMNKADVACGRYIERLAKYDLQWEDSWLESKFSRVKWLDQSQKTLTFIGDRVKFQNGFGAWSYHTYHCDYDPKTHAVLDARVFDGRL